MSSHEAPAYFCLTETPRERPPVDSCTEGRLFLTDERLLCGAGDPAVQNGYIGRVDAHAGSTVRRLLGGLKGFQDFTVDEARPREQTQTVGLDTLYSVAVVQWPTTELKGTGQTYGVKLESSEFADRSLIVQLGSGWRNRGQERTVTRLWQH